MWVKIVQQFEDSGRPIPVHRSIMLNPELLGWFVLKDAHDYKLRRHTRVAHLYDGRQNGKDLVPPLYGVETHECEDGFMTISGFQEDEVSGERTSQGWYMALPKGLPE